MLYRVLLQTHHMTSRKKIRAIGEATKRLDCAVYLKTGPHPPAIMIAECRDAGKEGLAGWVAAVKNLRYKGFHHVLSEQVSGGRLNVEFGSMMEFHHMRDLARGLQLCKIAPWWEEAMGYKG